MRIRKLILENFGPILAGTGKERIELNLESVTSRIIVFIGPIGSCKTYILSHLQPFATVGTLDVRNADDPIIEGKDGLKVFEFEKDGHEYIITHTYTWTGKSHTKKHSIIKDDTELNPNGNSASFLDLIQLELGIDQSFLRLIRIGANVSNFISMKATERKTFIANLLKDTEVYLYLYKCWSNDLRTINTKVNILMNKITTFSSIPLEDLKANMQDLEDDKRNISEKVDSLKEKRADLKANASSILGEKSIQEFLDELKFHREELKLIDTDIEETQKEMEDFKDLPSEKEINQMIGKADADLSRSIEEIQATTEAYENCMKRYNKARDKKAIQGDETHIITLKAQYASMVKEMEDIGASIQNFSCKYSTSQLESLLEDLNSMNMVINQICQYDQKDILFVYQSDSSIIEYSNKKVEVLNLRKIKVQRMMSNLQFSNDYIATQIMFRPPFCPTDTCPYFATHPVTIKRRDGGKKKLEPKLIEYQEELKALDIDIYKYSEYPFLYNKISSLKEFWRNLSPILKDIGALNISELKKLLLLSNYQSFYDHNKIINTIDFVKKRDMYYELTEKIKSIKNELSQFDIHKDESLDELLVKLTEEKEGLEKTLTEREEEKRKNQLILESLNDLYEKLSKQAQLKMNLDSHIEHKKSLTDLISKMEVQYDQLEIITKDITHVNSNLTVELDKFSDINQKIDEIRTKINDITYTSKELDGLLLEQKWMKLMTEAVSAKGGIPMQITKLFFDSCRDKINDMLYTIFGEDFEIVDFKITEKEFLIPYRVNQDVIINDISKASQGQSALVSLCISFALVSELMKRSGNENGIYNSLLLDEPDSAISKSDKSRLLAIIMKFIDDISCEQCFIITHSEDTYYGSDLQIVSTSQSDNITAKYPNAIFV